MENGSSPLISPEQLRAAVKQEMKHERRAAFWRRLGVYSGVFIVLGLLSVFVVGYVIAKLGVADVPLLSSRVYDPVQPARVVYPLVGSSAQNVLSGVLARGSFSAASQTMSVYASEQELTTMFNEAVSQSGTLKSVQTVITSEAIEVYGVLPVQDRDVPMIIRMLPMVKEQKLQVEVKDVVLGALSLPAVFVEAAVNAAVDQFSQSLKDSLGGGAVTNVVLEEGKIFVSFSAPSP